MIVHEYLKPSDNPAQAAADLIGRQEVTIDWYLDHTPDAPLFRWIEGAADYGLDPWRFHMDLPIEPEEAKRLGWRIFIQKRDLPGHMEHLLVTLRRAEAFVSGFEDDELQEGVGDLLNDLRAAIARLRRDA